MTTVQIAIYVILLCLEVMGISMFMEWYKKCLRKDNFKKWQDIKLIYIGTKPTQDIIIIFKNSCKYPFGIAVKFIHRMAALCKALEYSFRHFAW